MKTIVLLLCLLISFNGIAQNVKGTIYEISPENKKQTLPGANMDWEGTTVGVVSDANGKFSIAKHPFKNDVYRSQAIRSS